MILVLILLWKATRQPVLTFSASWPELAAIERISPRESFPFLELPFEVRVLVYRCVAEDNTTYLKPGGESRLRSSSALICVNKQINDEFEAELLFASFLIAKVENFSFDHVIRFLGDLGTIQLRTLKSRRFIISLDMTQDGWEWNGDMDLLLRRWVNCIADWKEDELDIEWCIPRTVAREDWTYFMKLFKEFWASSILPEELDAVALMEQASQTCGLYGNISSPEDPHVRWLLESSML